MDAFWRNPFVETAGYYSVTVLFIVLFLVVFEMVTKYRNWVEIKKGNMAVAMATGGKIFGIANIFRHSIENHNTLPVMIGLGSVWFYLVTVGIFHI